MAIPAQGAILRWRAKSYDSSFENSYEVRIMLSANPSGTTGAIGNQLTLSSVLLAVTAEEAGEWTAHAVNLASFAGQSMVRIGFRDNFGQQGSAGGRRRGGQQWP